jgi:hypothetical protein
MNDTNRKAVAKAEGLMRELLVRALNPKFHGRIVMEFVLKEGTIQTIRTVEDRSHRSDDDPVAA